MRNCAIWIIAAACLLLASTPSALAAKRMALVIGNDAYAQVTKLKKAVNDARAVGKALEAIGFKVMRAENLSRREMNRQIQLFASGLDTGDEALFFFAGHGVEINGRNYLLPIDIPEATPGQEGFVTTEAIAVDQVLGRIQERGTRISILVLDACRDNPFPKTGTRSLGGSRGLARMLAPEGTFIMYSAGVGQTALDRIGDDDPHANSVFTRSFVPLLRKPGLSLTAVARQVRRDVQKLARTISHDQRPAYYDEITGDFFFAGQGGGGAGAGAGVAAGLMSPTPIDPAAQAWQLISGTSTASELEIFIKRFPDGFYADLARARLAKLKEKKVALTVPPKPKTPTDLGKAPAHDCDRLAASPGDPKRLADPVPFGQIRAETAIAACRRAVEAYPATARFALQLGRALHRGTYHDEAYRWYRKAADKGVATAMNSVGYMYDHGLGIAKDSDEAVRWFRKAADSGDPWAMTNLGSKYSLGNGVGKDQRESVRWFRKAAAKGHGPAMTSLGVAYFHGNGVEKDQAEANRWYRKAAEKGNPSAMLNLGVNHEYGQGVRKDAGEAVRWYRKAAVKGDASAMNNLGVMYQHGKGTAKDHWEAARWFRKAAELGNAPAMNSLGVAYFYGNGIEKDLAKANDWYRRAAAKGDAFAMRNLGINYRLGQGVRKDQNEALKWFEKSAAKGNLDAMDEIGGLYFYGHGVKKDMREAARWYRKAADKGHPMSMFNLGLGYLTGRGVKRDYRVAAQWFFKAVDGGNTEALYSLAQIHENGWGVAKDHNVAAGYMLQALKAGYDFAQKEMRTNAKAWNVAFRRALQRLMRDEGTYQGAIDGQFGPGTQRAIAALAKN